MLFLRYFCFFATKYFTTVKDSVTLSFNGAQNAVKFNFYRGIKMIKKLTDLIVFIALGVSFGYLFAVALTMTN